MFAWGDNWKEDVKDCFPQSSFLVARAEGSLGCLLPERRQTSAFCVRVDSQGLLLRDGGGCGSQSLASQPRQEPLVSAGARQPRDSRVSLGRGAASLDFCHSPPLHPLTTTGSPQMGQELLTWIENRTGLVGPSTWATRSVVLSSGRAYGHEVCRDQHYCGLHSMSMRKNKYLGTDGDLGGHLH